MTEAGAVSDDVCVQLLEQRGLDLAWGPLSATEIQIINRVNAYHAKLPSI